MFEAMKIIHILALMAGGAATIGNGLLMAQVARSGALAPKMVARVMRIFGMIGLVAILTLWASGAVMAPLAGHGMGAEYAIKLIGATVVLVMVASMSFLAARAGKSGVPPNQKTMKRLASVSRLGLLVAIVFAVLAFN